MKPLQTQTFSRESVVRKLGISFWLSMFWILFVLFTACFADNLPLYSVKTMDWNNIAAPIATTTVVESETGDDVYTRVYILGTDTMGRDILSRLVYGSRVSLCVGLIAPLIGFLIGGGLGIIAGYYRGRADTIIMTGMDSILAFPALVFLMTVTFYLGTSLVNIVLALGILTIPSFARIAKANTLSLINQQFIKAARMGGQSDISIILREITPNIVYPLLVYSLLVVSYMILAEGALSFLGLGVPAPIPSWGGMISEGREMLEKAPHISLIPSLIMFVTVLCFNLIGDNLRNITDSKVSQI